MKVAVAFNVDVTVGKRGRKVTQDEILTAIRCAVANRLPPVMYAEEWIVVDGNEPDIKVICDPEVKATVL